MMMCNPLNLVLIVSEIALAVRNGGGRPAKAGNSIELITSKVLNSRVLNSKVHIVLITMASYGGDWLSGGWHNENVNGSKKNSNGVCYDMIRALR